MKIIELSHQMFRSKEEYTLEIETKQVEKILPQYHRLKDDWYIMQKMEINCHVGTHIESPYHHRKDGNDISKIPITNLICPAIKLDFTYKKPNEEITLEELKNALKGRAINGFTVLFHTGRDKYYHDPIESHKRPYPKSETIKWLINQGISTVGIDCTGIEVKGAEGQPNHKMLFASNIPLIENMTNLEQITDDTFMLFTLPLKIAELESCPVRVIAIEGILDYLEHPNIKVN